jgi:hypothetical protein
MFRVLMSVLRSTHAHHDFEPSWNAISCQGRAILQAGL